MKSVKRITKGKALLIVRGILGPSGHVRITPRGCECGTFGNAWQTRSCGYDWKASIAVLQTALRIPVTADA